MTASCDVRVTISKRCEVESLPKWKSSSKCIQLLSTLCFHLTRLIYTLSSLSLCHPAVECVVRRARCVWVQIPLCSLTRRSAPRSPYPQHPHSCLATLSVHGDGANKRPLSSSARTPQLGQRVRQSAERRVAEQMRRDGLRKPERAGQRSTKVGVYLEPRRTESEVL